uniref:Reverse transcriptase Ty1/copia-type domain-containing protein n=1 Tax=Solanum lycopersicum TaxID=4081 RepID=A0A3Q7EC26_SOLLC
MAVSSSTNGADTPFAHITHFRSLIGALQYLAITRPNIQCAVNRVAQHMHQPSEHDYHCLKCILRYIFGTLGRGLLIRPGDLELRRFSDSDWVNNKNDRKSTSGFLLFFGAEPDLLVYKKITQDDTGNEIKNRIKNMWHEEVEIEIVKGISEMLDEHNVLVKLLHMARDRYREEPNIEFCMCLLSERTNDDRQYNIPTTSEVAGLIIGEIIDVNFQ